LTLNDEELAALSTLTVVYPSGAEFPEADVPVLESLVQSGHAVRVEGGDYSGRGYVLSPEMVEAHRQVIANGNDRASQN
jgi:hypothetical protein